MLTFVFNMGMDNKKIIIGSRGSDLALWQANFVKNQLKDICQTDAEIEIIHTKGDKILDVSFDKIEGKGFFTKELEDALLNQSIDLAIHSMKDLPTTSPDGLCLGGVSYREDPRDCLLISKLGWDDTKPLKLKSNAVVGTSSVRRKAQMMDLRNDISTSDLRGNVPTRIRKLREGNYDAIILAKAGLLRLNLDLSDLHIVDLHPAEFVPAPAQGVLAYQCRESDVELRKKLVLIHQKAVAECTNVERAILKAMDGGCQVPLGIYCYKDVSGNFHIHAAWSPGIDQALIRVRKSQSTTFGLAESVLSELKKS